jgi:hypothetical protein
MLKHIRVDPVTHVRNQFKAAIAQTAAAFKDVTFGNDKKQLMTAEKPISIMEHTLSLITIW